MFVLPFGGLVDSLKDTSIKIQNVLGSLFWVLSVVGIYNFILHPPNFILNNDRILFDLSQFLNSGFLILMLVVIGALLLGLIFLKQKLQFIFAFIRNDFLSVIFCIEESVLLRENFDTRSNCTRLGMEIISPGTIC